GGVASRGMPAELAPIGHENDHAALLRRSKLCEGDSRFLGHGMSCYMKEAGAILAVLSELTRWHAGAFFPAEHEVRRSPSRQPLVTRVPFRFLRRAGDTNRCRDVFQPLLADCAAQHVAGTGAL